MIQVQNTLDRLLFSDHFPPELLPKSDNRINMIEKEFWDSRYDMNLCLNHLEVEVRLGRINGRSFQSGVPVRIFERMSQSLQSYTEWDSVTHERSTVLNFDTQDGSLRCVQSSDGTMSYVSKQRVCTLDFNVHGSCSDVRLAASLEVPVQARPALRDATRRVTRDRASFALGPWRYDLTKTYNTSDHEYHIELELTDIATLQTSDRNAQRITELLRTRLLDLLRVIDPELVRVDLALKSQRWY